VVRVLVEIGVQTGLVRFVQAATMTVGLPALVKVNPKQLVWMPKVASFKVCGFQRIGVEPENVSHPVVPEK